MKFLILALCVVSATAFPKRCKSADDCEEGECCVNYVLVSFFGGHCQKLRDQGESCTPLVKETDETPDMYHYQCPCKEGLSCDATSEIKIGNHIIKYKPECMFRNSTAQLEEIDVGGQNGGDDGGYNGGDRVEYYRMDST